MRLAQCARCSKVAWHSGGLPALSAASVHAEMVVEEEGKMSWPMVVRGGV